MEQTTEERLAINIAVNEAFILRTFPNEEFFSTTDELRKANKFTEKLELPENVRLAKSRIPITKGEQEKLIKELRQACILAKLGYSIYLTPEPGRFKERSFDAVVNGIQYEFRNITGKNEKVERRFSQAKDKGDDVNVFMNIDTDISSAETRRRITLVLERHPEYTGKIIISWRGGIPSFYDTEDFW